MLTAFSDAPCLREADLSGASLEWISLPWNQLTKLEFSYQSLSACVEILAQTPNLEVLVTSAQWRPETAPTPPRLLPMLHALRFTYDPDGLLFDYLTLPALKTLTLTALDHGGSARLHNSGVRSAWSLPSIQLTCMSPDATILCLRHIPSLETVFINNTEYFEVPWGPVVELLTHDDTFVPAVRSLMLKGLGDGISTASFVDMLVSRRNGQREGMVKLEFFRLEFGRYDDPDFVERVRSEFRPLTIEGLNIEVI
ncbi:hypothetical protein DFH09DRAFT_1199135 [Mycena vulgaris]|nr:hypothetical protein DFH09DRAFT_1199135 [Mycena vulgaris]